MVHTGSESLQDWLGDVQTCLNNLGFSLCATPSVYHMITTSDGKKKSEIEMSTNWYVTIEHWRLSLIRIIFVNYQTSELQCNY